MAAIDPSLLEQFFAAPNELNWATVLAGQEPAQIADVLRPWLTLAQSSVSEAPIILPFVRGGEIAGWYAVARTPELTDEARDMLRAWIGLTWASRFEPTSAAMSDPLAAILRQGVGGTVFRFGGANAAANRKIGTELVALAGLLCSRPVRQTNERRPVGVVRAEFDRALLVGDAARAVALIEELKGTGRLNDENLRYLEVRQKAGLSLWPQLAHDHWLIKTLSELYLPPQILADLVEALYRTHLEPLEQQGDLSALQAAFVEAIASKYPRLFATRRGIRTPRVAKAFLLFERAQAAPNPELVKELAALLPAQDQDGPIFSVLAIPPTERIDPLEAADEAFDDGQTDRAFEFYLAAPLSRRVLGRLILCASLIDTRDATTKTLDRVAGQDSLISQLTPQLQAKLEVLRSTNAQGTAETYSPPSIDEPNGEPVAQPREAAGWLEWAQQLRAGALVPLPGDAVVTWDARSILDSASRSAEFAADLENLAGEAARLARLAVPSIYRAFFEEQPVGAGAKPIASTLFMLIALDVSLSSVDLELLAQLLTDLATLGWSSDEYIGLLDTLDDVASRAGSYSNLAWSLDVAETLALAPSPSQTATEARLQFFLQTLARGQVFAHRLRSEERHAFAVLAQDYAVSSDLLGPITAVEAADNSIALPDLAGKTIGIYTLTEAAGARAKTSLEAMFTGVTVTLNADQVATARLTNLAKNADYFVFAWRSSSHQAYFCIKDAMGNRDPIMPGGKGTASIIRALISHLQA